VSWRVIVEYVEPDGSMHPIIVAHVDRADLRSAAVLRLPTMKASRSCAACRLRSQPTK
jgi:hypothetical protein